MEASGINNKGRSTHGRLFLLVLLMVIVGRAVAQDDAALIRSSFNQLKSGFKSKNGKQAADLVDGHTLAYYYNAFKEARSLDSTRVERLSGYEKALVFNIRLHANAANMKPVDARSCFISTMANGWVTSWGIFPAFSEVEIGGITVDKDSATVSLLLDGFKMPQIRFRREGSQWKADLMSWCTFTSQMYIELAQSMKISETKAVLCMMGNFLPDDKPDPAIWKPLVIQ